MKTSTKFIIGGGIALGVAALLYATTSSKVNMVKNLTFAPLFYGGVNDMKVSTSGVKLPLAVDLGNRSDQTLKLRLNAVDVYQNGKKIASSTAELTEVTLNPYSTSRMKLNVVVSLTYVASLLSTNILNLLASGDYNKILSKFDNINLRIDFTVNDAIQSPIMVDLNGGEVKLDGLGLVQAGYHRIRPKSDYLHLIAPESALKRNDKIIISDVVPEQTAQFIRLKAKECKKQTERLAQALLGSTKKQSARNIFDFVYNYIQYTPDSQENEEVRSPLRTLHDQKGDCDCMTLLVCSMFENLGIPYDIRISEYNHKGYFQHVYAIASVNGLEVPCDPVVCRFDYEKPTTAHKDF